MIEEKQLIDKMLKDKKISRQEADELLSALKKSYGLDQDQPVDRKEAGSPEIKQDQFEEEGASCVSDFQERIEDFGEEYQGEFATAAPEIKIDNFNGQIRLSCWDQDTFKLKVKYHWNNYYPQVPSSRSKIVSFQQHTKGLSVFTKKRYGFALRYDLGLYLPANNRYKLEINHFNGSIYLDDLKFINADLQLTNGNIQANNYQAKAMEVSLTNGNVYLQGLADKIVVNIQNGNGEINIPEGVPCFLEGSSKIGNVKFALKDLKYLEKDIKMFKKHLIAASPDWEDSEKRIQVKATTKNGNIKIDNY